MAVSNTYVVRHLLQETLRPDGGIVWHERPMEQAGYTTCAGDLRIELERVYCRAGSRLLLRFRCDNDDFSLLEPEGHGWFGRRYHSEDDATLAELMRTLMRAAGRQCHQRRVKSLENPNDVRERVYQNLLFGFHTKSS